MERNADDVFVLLSVLPARARAHPRCYREKLWAAKHDGRIVWDYFLTPISSPGAPCSPRKQFNLALSTRRARVRTQLTWPGKHLIVGKPIKCWHVTTLVDEVLFGVHGLEMTGHAQWGWLQLSQSSTSSLPEVNYYFVGGASLPLSLLAVVKMQAEFKSSTFLKIFYWH